MSLKLSRGPYLVADVGGTNARFGIYRESGLGEVRVLAADDHPEFASAVATYLDGIDEDRPVSACIAVAGPVTGDQVTLTNRSWTLSASQLQQTFSFGQVSIINDFQALAMAIPFLEDGDLFQIGPDHEPETGKPKVILGPGTGLGVASLVPTGCGWLPLPGEGGHMAFAPCNPLEDRLLAAMHQRLERVSVEHLLSGPGLETLYELLIELGEIDGAPLRAEGITNRATRGNKKALYCLDLFSAMLGAYAGDLALALGARGGVYIGGGIVPRICDYMAQGPFRERFEAKGRMSHFVRNIPTWIIVAHYPALTGAAAWLAGQESSAEEPS